MTEITSLLEDPRRWSSKPAAAARASDIFRKTPLAL
jgi:hypothetical protein